MIEIHTKVRAHLQLGIFLPQMFLLVTLQTVYEFNLLRGVLWSWLELSLGPGSLDSFAATSTETPGIPCCAVPVLPARTEGIVAQHIGWPQKGHGSTPTAALGGELFTLPALFPIALLLRDKVDSADFPRLYWFLVDLLCYGSPATGNCC